MPSYTNAELERDVRALARPEGRMVGTAGHARAAEYLKRRLGDLGLRPYAGDGFGLPYVRSGIAFENIVGIAPSGSGAEAEPVLIAAHYDTAGPKPGADDNAAAVAIALGVAARLVDRPAARDVAIALFDAEEPPFFQTPSMGSVRFVRRQMRRRVHAALVMDLVGHDVPIPGVEHALFVTGMESDPDLEAVVRSRPDPDRIGVVTAWNRYVGDMSDHHAFRLSEIPYLFLTCGRWEHYHCTTDTPDRLAYDKMRAVATLLEHLVRDVAERDLDGPWEGYDTTATDLELMRETLGPLAGRMGLQLRDRSDIERVAALLMSRFEV